MSASSAVYLVSGATGLQGGSVARELLEAGYRVHALVRDLTKPAAKELEALGATLFVGDYSNADAINKATVGVKGVFINPYPDFTNPLGEAEQTQRFVDAALAAGTVEHLVISTIFHVDYYAKWFAAHPDHPVVPSYRSKSAAEDVVRNSGVKYWTILRPPWLMHNFLFPQSAIHHPKLHTERLFSTALTRDAGLALLDAEDIGRWAAAAFERPETFARKEIDLAAENVTPEEAVGAISKVAGVEIATSFLEPADFLKEFPEGSFIAPLSTAFAEHNNEAGGSISSDELAALKGYGIPFTTFTEFLEKNKSAVLATLKVDP
ncbi:NAD(P)-binding protein [Exidia glandulosa HHB12029]|uniref:NAD(P)-binding protein n=1 Tax=Exidia glandulosa HHB12029 TaxID=1314781 RepID=A0A166AKY1_EXIGL|nr:NAD(P)-binding protein [Exidia glandulosa HHB12029]